MSTKTYSNSSNFKDPLNDKTQKTSKKEKLINQKDLSNLDCSKYIVPTDLNQKARQDLLKVSSIKEEVRHKTIELTLNILGITVILSFVLYGLALMTNKNLEGLNKFTLSILSPVVSLCTGTIGYYYGRKTHQ